MPNNKLFWKIVFFNALFLVVVGITLSLIWKSEREKAVVVPLPETAIASEGGEGNLEVLSIPSIGVDAQIQAVGRAQSGNMAVPTNFADVGWYRHGPLPGESGNAVIAGHLDTGRGKPAVFYNLKDLRVGESVFVVKGGERLEFKVREIALVDYYNPPLEKIFGPSDSPQLNIITCDGTWIPEQKTYDQRLVVYTEYVGREALGEENS